MSGKIHDTNKGPCSCVGGQDDRDYPSDPDQAGCTDVFCLLFFVIYWIGILGVGIASISTGDLAALWYGADYLGNRCGVGAMQGKQDVWWPRMSTDLALQNSLIAQGRWNEVKLYGLCVEECPKSSPTTEPVSDYGWLEGHDSARAEEWQVYISTATVLNRCLPIVEKNSSTVVLCAEPTCHEVFGKTTNRCYSHNTDVIGHNTWQILSKAEAGRCNRELDLFVSTTAKQANAGFFLTAMLDVMSKLEAVYNALDANVWTIAFFGVLVPLIISCLWMVFFFFFAGVAVYIAIFLLILVLFATTGVCAYKGGLSNPFLDRLFIQSMEYAETKLASTGYDVNRVKSSALVQSAMEVDASMQDMYKWAAIILAVLLIMVIVFICLASAQIKRTTALVSEGTKVVKNSPAMIFVPMAIYVAQIVSVVICAFILAYLWTDPAKSYESALGWAESLLEDDKATSNVITAIDPINLLWYEMMFVAFGALWTYLFFEAIETTVISGCVVYYYFIDQDTAGIKDERYADNQTDFITLSMIAHVIKCNLGTMAFGSLILALIEVARIILEWIDKQTESVQNSNVLLRYALKCCKCCLFCFERSLKFLTSYAYTFVILENRGFCSACAMSYSLLTEYSVQISINKVVCVVLYWIQSITTPIICSLLGYRLMIELDPEIKAGVARPFDYYGPLIPTCAIFFLAFMMARSFAGVYEQIVTSLTVCVLNDIRNYDPPFIQKQMYEAFELSPPWGDRKIANGPSGEPKDKSKTRPFAKRSLYGNKGSGVTPPSMNRHDYQNMQDSTDSQP